MCFADFSIRRWEACYILTPTTFIDITSSAEIFATFSKSAAFCPFSSEKIVVEMICIYYVIQTENPSKEDEAEKRKKTFDEKMLR